MTLLLMLRALLMSWIITSARRILKVALKRVYKVCETVSNGEEIDLSEQNETENSKVLHIKHDRLFKARKYKKYKVVKFPIQCKVPDVGCQK